jgi:hypothetical protein
LSLLFDLELGKVLLRLDTVRLSLELFFLRAGL